MCYTDHQQVTYSSLEMRAMKFCRSGILLLSLLVGSTGQSSASEPWRDWTETSATSTFYNVQAGLRWRNQPIDFRDANDVAQGSKPYAEITIADTDQPRTESWKVTNLVKEWLSGQARNSGFLLRAAKGKANFSTRENKDPDQHPKLLVRTMDGGEHSLTATDDTFISVTTSNPLGKADRIEVGWAMVKFDLSSIPKGTDVAEAWLQLFTTQQYRHATIGVFRVDSGGQEPPTQGKTPKGLAEKYPNDQGIAKDPNVVHFTDFETFDWSTDWTIDQNPTTIEPIKDSQSLEFEPLSGRALKAVIPKGGNLALNLLYKFAENLGYEPEEIFMRYYLRLANDWNPTSQGGKFPGIAGTYGRAGWGGRKSDGENGWSMRGSFNVVPKEDNPLHGQTPIGTYAYHADMQARYGSGWPWSIDGLGVLKRNRWYSIEQHVKLNTPGKRDGIMRAWVDGKLAFENHEVNFRTTDALKIDRIWMNVYHGGTGLAPEDYHLFIDNVVIAKNYIGPMSEGTAASQ